MECALCGSCRGSRRLLECGKAVAHPDCIVSRGARAARLPLEILAVSNRDSRGCLVCLHEAALALRVAGRRMDRVLVECLGELVNEAARPESIGEEEEAERIRDVLLACLRDGSIGRLEAECAAFVDRTGSRLLSVPGIPADDLRDFIFQPSWLEALADAVSKNRTVCPRRADADALVLRWRKPLVFQPCRQLIKEHLDDIRGGFEARDYEMVRNRLSTLRLNQACLSRSMQAPERAEFVGILDEVERHLGLAVRCSLLEASNRG